MRDGWEIKKLTDVCSIQYGCAFDSSLFSDSSEDGMPLIRIRDIKDGYSNTYYKGSYADEYVIHRGDYLIGMDGEFNIEPWKSEDALLNQRVCKIESKLKDVSIRFIYRFLKKELKRIEDETPFVTVKHLSAKRLNQVVLDIPPLPEQEKIVAELDCLSGIIEKKRQQLKELDALAQSIFHEMFGNPVENEKGWEVKALEQLCSIVNGFAFPSSAFSESNPIKAIKITNVGVNEFVHDDSSLPNQYNSKEDFKVHTGDIVIALTRTVISTGLKRAIIPKEYNNALVNQRVAAIITDNKVAEKNFIYSFLGTDFVKDYVLSHATALMQPNLSIKDLRELPVIQPPLPLQQTFASKIEAIEKQKELIKQSLGEVETLFNARMQEYFG